MHALSIMQPWAWAILRLGKNIENRDWSTSFRGPFLIHAGKRFDKEGSLFLRDQGYQIPANLPLGGFVGRAEVVDCVNVSRSPWFYGPYGFLLRNAQAFERLVPYPGKLGFFPVDAALLEQIQIAAPPELRPAGLFDDHKPQRIDR